jgi:hypothetical protein
MRDAIVRRLLTGGPRSLVLCAVMIAFGVSAPASYAGGGGRQQPGITITSNADLVPTPAAPMGGCGCVTSGNGTAASPYVIGPWAITGPNNSGSAITVDNSGGKITDYFSITGVSANYNDLTRSDPVIHLIDINTATTISNVSANDDGIGIKLDDSSNITLDSISVNKMNGTGLWVDGSSNITSINGKYKATSDGLKPSSHWADGLYAVDSSNLQIGGTPGCPNNGICNTFDYDSGWGVYLQNTQKVTIDNATANADDTGGYILDGSSNVTLENSTSEAGGPICISLNGAKQDSGYLPTDLVGGLMLVNGASHDTISNDTFNGTNLTSGFSIGDGGNELAGNPIYFDVCTGMDVPAPPLDGPMGANITFTNVCYGSTSIPTTWPGPPPGQPTSSCKS